MTLTTDSNINIRFLWGQIRTSTKAGLHIVFRGDFSCPVLLETMSHFFPHSEYNAIAICVETVRDHWPGIHPDSVIRIYRTQDENAETTPGLFFYVYMGDIHPLVLSLRTHVHVAAIHHFHLEAMSLFNIELLSFIGLMRPYTFVTSVTLKAQMFVSLDAFLSVDRPHPILPKLDTLTLQMMALRSRALHNSTSELPEVWTDINNGLEGRASSGMPIQRLKLSGPWLMSEGRGVRVEANLTDVDKSAINRARTLVTELIDERPRVL